jgi:hypothetical protein
VSYFVKESRKRFGNSSRNLETVQFNSSPNFEKYEIKSGFFQIPNLFGIYNLDLPFSICSTNMYNVIDLATRRDYRFVKTWLKLPENIYKKMKDSSPPTYERPSIVSNVSSNQYAHYFKLGNPSIDGESLIFSPIEDQVSRYFGITTFSSPLYSFNSTTISGTVNSNDDLKFLNYMLSESSISIYLKNLWKLNFSEFRNRMEEITS